jgi:hypothetical protein
VDGQWFAAERSSVWKGLADQGEWWWEVSFTDPVRIGTILEIHSDRERTFRSAPENYHWQWSRDGLTWENLPETVIRGERRLFRIHRLAETRLAKAMRLVVQKARDEAPALREVAFFPEINSEVPFPDWAVIISSEVKDVLPADSPHLFVQLIRQCPGWEAMQFQQINYQEVDEAFVAVEPRPLCALLTGSSTDWCQVPPAGWKGVEQILKNGHLPMWAACGGAQALAILWEHGTEHRWDCPRCRNPQKPLSPVYSHIDLRPGAACGDFRGCKGEFGKFRVHLVARDPAFEGLPELFETMEAHYGQIDYVPRGWVRVVTKGPEGYTENQCLRLAHRYIYAAQFHIELPGTPESSRIIMSNFLRLAKAWGGYNPHGQDVPPPDPLPPDLEAPEGRSR